MEREPTPGRSWWWRLAEWLAELVVLAVLVAAAYGVVVAAQHVLEWVFTAR